MATPPPYGTPQGPGPYPGPHRGAAPNQAPQRAVSNADKAFTTLLICLSPLVCALTTFVSLFSITVASECGDQCTSVTLGFYLMTFGPWVLWVVFSIWAIVRLIRKRSAIWGMLIGLGLAIVVYVGGNALMIAGT